MSGCQSNVPIKPTHISSSFNKTDGKLGALGIEATTGITGKSNSGGLSSIRSTNSTNIFNCSPGTSTSGLMTNGAVPRQTADYNRSHFMNVNTTLQINNNNVNNASESSSAGNSFTDVFADILGEQGFKFSQKVNQSPRSINDMRKVERMKDMDPKQALIMEWVCLHGSHLQNCS